MKRLDLSILFGCVEAVAFGRVDSLDVSVGIGGVDGECI